MLSLFPILNYICDNILKVQHINLEIKLGFNNYVLYILPDYSSVGNKDQLQLSCLPFSLHIS
jgi:hypothetical protein